jgi:hypothetical protein
MAEETRTRPASEVQQIKIGEDGYWECPLPISDMKYRMREATIGEIADSAAGARSNKEEIIRKITIVTQEQNSKGAWVQLEWPKDGAEILLETLNATYQIGLGAKAVRTKNSLKPTNAATPTTPKSNA